jgi:SAM-dependent methyltransferase
LRLSILEKSMRLSAVLRVPVLALLIATTGLALAQAQRAPATATFEPEVGQPGKDVVWVPTPQAVVDKMLDLARVTPKDFVIDLGSGDGRTVITAAKRGAHALGIEYNPDMVALSKKNAETAGVTDRAEFMQADLFETDLSKATVITMFLLPDINLKLRPKLLGLKPGTRIASRLAARREADGGVVRRLLVHRALLDRAGARRRPVQAAAGRADTEAVVPDALGHVHQRRAHRADQREGAG